jgi:uncharacterized Tic20 family protein
VAFCRRGKGTKPNTVNERRKTMRNISIILICLSVLGFVLAAISAFLGDPIAGVTAEGFSQGSTNVALIAIALTVCLKGGSKE